MIVNVRRTLVVWEVSEFPADIPDGVDAQSYVREHLDELAESASEAGSLEFSEGTRSDDLEVTTPDGP